MVRLREVERENILRLKKIEVFKPSYKACGDDAIFNLIDEVESYPVKIAIPYNYSHHFDWFEYGAPRLVALDYKGQSSYEGGGIQTMTCDSVHDLYSSLKVLENKPLNQEEKRLRATLSLNLERFKSFIGSEIDCTVDFIGVGDAQITFTNMFEKEGIKAFFLETDLQRAINSYGVDAVKSDFNYIILGSSLNSDLSSILDEHIKVDILNAIKKELDSYIDSI